MNMNSRSNFYIVSDFLKTLLQSDPLVNTVIIGKTNETDLYKKNLFPIAHIIPINSPWIGPSVSAFTFQIGILEQRDIASVKKNTKFEGDDNMIDNLNSTYAVLNNLISYLQNQNNSHYIEVESVSGVQPFLFVKENLLDGWYVTITLTIKNDSVCYGFDLDGDGLVDSGEEPILTCPEKTYIQMNATLNNPMIPSIQTDIRTKTPEEILSYWLDNENYSMGIGGLNIYLCGTEQRFEVGSVIRTTNTNSLLSSLFNGYYLANQTGASGFGELNGNQIRYRYNPLRRSPYNLNNPQIDPITELPNDPIPFGFWADTVEPVIVKMENSIITEVIPLPMTGFTYEN